MSETEPGSGAKPSPRADDSRSSGDTPPLGAIHRIDASTVLVTGQGLSIARQQPDVANSVVHRSDQTLIMIDTGVTDAFRRALRDAVTQVGPWDRMIVLTSHGHVDHVGNDDVADELAAARGIRAEHYYPAADLGQISDPTTYWTSALAPLAGLAPLPGPPAAAAAELTSWFKPFRPLTSNSSPYESLLQRPISVGFHHGVGWTLAQGAVQILPSQGHCAGHVLIYLPRARLLHVGDELNGPTACMPDADQLKLTTARQTISTMLEDGRISYVTDGHRPFVLCAEDAREILDTEREHGIALLNWATLTLANQAEIHLDTLLPAFAAEVARLGLVAVNPSPVFTAMTVIKTLRGLGYEPSRDPHVYQRAATTRSTAKN